MLRNILLLLLLCTTLQAATTQPTFQESLNALNAAHSTTVTQLAAANAEIKRLSATQPSATQPYLGWNLDFVGNWTGTIYPDLARKFGGWSPNWETPTGAFATDANGYPLTHAGTSSDIINVPACDCIVTYEGAGSLSFGGQQYTPTTSNSGVLHFVPTAQSVPMHWHNTDPTKPLKNLHIWLPGYSNESFTREVTSTLANFNSIRSLQATGGITSNEVNWSDRKLPTHWSWSPMPWELQIQLAKDSNVKILWPCTPLTANVNYVLQLARLHHDTYNGIVLPELSDELWNTSWPFVVNWQAINKEAIDSVTGQQYDGTITAGVWKQSPQGTSVTNPQVRTWRCAAERAYRHALIWNSVYADRPNDCRPVIAGQAAYPAVLSEGLAFLKAKYKTLPFKYAAIAPYHYPTFGQKYTTSAALLAADAVMIQTELPGYLTAHTNLCKTYGLVAAAYECGASYDSFFYNDPAVRINAFASPQFPTNENLYWPQIKQSFPIANAFTFYGSPAKSNADGTNPVWTMILDFTSLSTNPRYQSVLINR